MQAYPNVTRVLIGGFSGRLIRSVAALVCMLLLASSVQAAQIPISIKLTAPALGFPDTNINDGGTVDPDVPGKLITSSTPGVGSILTVQQSGLAGPGTALDPLFVTLTAKTHLDVTGAPADYYAGVLFISDEDSATPDGRKEGIGVRAFKVDSNGDRMLSTGLAELVEGSKHVSGGTDVRPWDPNDPNGAPHVDELVNFEFAAPVIGQSIEVLLSEFDPSDIVDLHIERAGGLGDIDRTFVQTTDTNLFEEIGDKLWKLKFSGITGTSGLGPNDLVTNFDIRANDDQPWCPSDTAEHFYITGATATIPEPAVLSLWLAVGGGLTMARRRRR